ncbi:MAG: hypothetical protein IJ939_00970 [Clostridia bacterium]|nr:hypothetical protein [Clostridia bacterium]
MNKIIIASENLYPESLLYLQRMGYTVKTLKSQDGMEKAVSSHPDMYIAHLGDAIVADYRVHDLLTSFDSKTDIKFGGREVHDASMVKYPDNIGFNCARVGKNIICNEKYTSPLIIEHARKQGLNILNVRQGYAKCSTCVITDNAIITEDESIYNCATDNGIDVLKIRKGHVELPGYDYGFIGGCSGLIEKKLVAFNGNVMLHPDAAEIVEFCYKHDVGIVSVCNKKLSDIGSIIRIC